MKNNANSYAIEGSALFGNMDGISSYTYNLIKHLSIIEKEDKFFIWYTQAPLFRRGLIDFRQHNIIHKKSFFPFPAMEGLKIFHDTGLLMPGPEKKQNRITTIHDLSSILLPFSGEKEKRAIKLRLAEAIKTSDIIIAPSQNTKNDLLKHFGAPDNKIDVVYEGIGEEFYPQTSLKSSLVRTRYSIKRPYMLFLGKINETKNVRGLLEAYSLLKYESPPDLVIAGNSDAQSLNIKKLAEELEISNNVKHLGYIPKTDIPALMSGAEIFVWPSFYEGFGLPVLEAMACGAPVISSSNSCIPEIVGDAGILVDPGNIQKISAAMKKVLADKEIRLSMKKKSLERSKYFSAKKMAAETLNIYRRISAN